MPLTLLLPLMLVQAAAPLDTGAAPPIQHPPAVERRVPRGPSAPPRERPSAAQSCLAAASEDPAMAVTSAQSWLAASRGSARVEPNKCLGVAYSRLDQWQKAEVAFLAGRDAAAASDPDLRARLGALAGNAALAHGALVPALAAFDAAHGDAVAADDIALKGEIALDRARVLVDLHREDEAARALVEARTSTSDNPLAWLLSATLSRRQGKLVAAQAQIETAAGLQQADMDIAPEIGLEAGVIAMLSDNEQAARASWQSVIGLAPQSEAAAAARLYLDQLGPTETPAQAPAAKP